MPNDNSQMVLSHTETKTICDSEVCFGENQTVYSDPFVIEGIQNFTIFLKVSGSSPSIKITKCYNPSTLNSPVYNEWAEKDINGNEDVLVANFTQTDWCAETLNPKLSVWMRLKCLGLAGNGNDTKIDMKIVMGVSG